MSIWPRSLPRSLTWFLTMSRARFSFSDIRTTCLAAFSMPVIILLVIMAFSRVWPLGQECILRTDMYHQYAPFFSELREKLQHG
ncbi:MAG: YfhO family protein, partial [Lachnospiraceae bacterium]|nr:YfhO family protein [Lachnospiraceae bacterium]